MNSPRSRPHVIVVGSGGRPYREYAFATLARRYRVSAVLPSEPTWQHRYISESAVADLADPDAIAAAVCALAGGRPETGLLTWDETVLEATAKAAEKLGLPHMSAHAAARCRDKYATRTLLEQAGLRVREAPAGDVGAGGGLCRGLVRLPSRSQATRARGQPRCGTGRGRSRGAPGVRPCGVLAVR